MVSVRTNIADGERSRRRDLLLDPECPGKHRGSGNVGCTLLGEICPLPVPVPLARPASLSTVVLLKDRVVLNVSLVRPVVYLSSSA